MKKTLVIEVVISLALITIFILAIVIMINKKPSAPLQSQEVENLISRMKQIGIPLTKIDVLQTAPLEIKIIVQGATNSKSPTIDDQWNWFLASREATLAYLIGTRIKSYRLVLLNSSGEIISDGTTYLYPDDFSQKVTMANKPSFDLTTTKEMLEKRLLITGFKIALFQVNTDKIVRENTRFVDIVLTYPSTTITDETSNTINDLINSLRSSLNDIDFLEQTQISLTRLQIKDEEGNVLTHFIYDNDTKSQTWSTAKGINGNWFPRPAIDSTQSSSSITSTPTLTSSQNNVNAYPPPEVTPTTTPTPGQYP